MVPAGTSRETDFGREVPAFEVDAMAVEPVFHRLYSYIFDMESGRYSGEKMDRPVPSAIFIVNFDKVRVDPRKKDIDLESLMYGRISQLTEEEMKKQEGDYVYRYRYNGGGASQVCLSSGRFVVIDLSASPCTYGKIETEEGSVSSKTLPRLRNVMFPKGLSVASDHSAHDIFVGQVAALVATTIEHVIAPDVRCQMHLVGNKLHKKMNRARGHQINAFIFKFKARGMKMKFRNQMNVLEVNKTDYENCISDHPLHNWTTGAGRDVVPLNVTHKYYFISGKGFCYGGMKFVNFFSSLFYLNISM